LSVSREMSAFKPLGALHGREYGTLHLAAADFVADDICRKALITGEKIAENIEPIRLGERTEHHGVEDKSSLQNGADTHGFSPVSLAKTRSSALIWPRVSSSARAGVIKPPRHAFITAAATEGGTRSCSRSGSGAQPAASMSSARVGTRDANDCL